MVESIVRPLTRTRHRLLWLGGLVVLGLGCDGGEKAAPPTAGPVAHTTSAATRPASTPGPRVVFLGDSLTAGYGMDDVAQAFPAVVERQLSDEGIRIAAVNAGVSGDTTAGGLRRLDWLLRQKPDVLVICLGGNDGLRHLDVAATKQNLQHIITRAKAAGAEVLLLGMMIPTNYGPEYREQFAAIFPALATETGVAVVPFALEGVGGIPDLNQPDGIHPTADGHRVIAANVIGPLRRLLAQRARPA